MKCQIHILITLGLLLVLGTPSEIGISPPGALPDRILSPGHTVSTTTEQICVRGYAKGVRHVTESKKRAVYIRYGLVNRKKGQYVIDHVINLGIGGSNEIANLFPQPSKGVWNSRVKDKIENELRKRVCNGDMKLEDAQAMIAKNWIRAYKTIFKTETPIKRHI
jgi:hypothetical protein